MNSPDLRVLKKYEQVCLFLYRNVDCSTTKICGKTARNKVDPEKVILSLSLYLATLLTSHNCQVRRPHMGPRAPVECPKRSPY